MFIIYSQLQSRLFILQIHLMKYICSQGFIYIAMYFMRFCCSIAGSVPKHLMSSSASKIAEMNLKSWLTEQHMMEAGISDRPGMVTEQGSSECHGSTHSWPGSKLGLAPIRCCRTRPKRGENVLAYNCCSLLLPLPFSPFFANLNFSCFSHSNSLICNPQLIVG
jgi:hypothetical protein